ERGPLRGPASAHGGGARARGCGRRARRARLAHVASAVGKVSRCQIGSPPPAHLKTCPDRPAHSPGSREAPATGTIFRMSVTPPRRWRPSTLIRASAVLHLGAAATTLVRPQLWPWTLSSAMADHLILAAAGLWPRSRLLGPNWTRLPQLPAA